MIIGSYKHLTVPRELQSPNWETAFKWLAEEKWKDLPEGKVEIAGSRVYATRSLYIPKPFEDTKYETHRRYADIQILQEGTEIMFVCDPGNLNSQAPYNPEGDFEFFTGNPSGAHRIILTNPLAAILFPSDAHRPGIAATENPSPVKKLVVKVYLD
ncbi:MAG: YhcH/YjgK/YiaL family protein [Treponema sp.]|jgi:YhcH/YjgK/YiaL family protein|nr:YhcH/YjgK/YiaL family protein [Treponema sp.]